MESEGEFFHGKSLNICTDFMVSQILWFCNGSTKMIFCCLKKFSTDSKDMFEVCNVFSKCRAIQRTSIHGDATRTSRFTVENRHRCWNIHPGGLFDMRISKLAFFLLFWGVFCDFFKSYASNTKTFIMFFVLLWEVEAFFDIMTQNRENRKKQV